MKPFIHVAYTVGILISIVITFFITKGFYEVKPVPLPQTKVEAKQDSISIPAFDLQAHLSDTTIKQLKTITKIVAEHNIPAKIDTVTIIDTVKMKVTEAIADTSIPIPNDFQYGDTTYTAKDTLRLQLKYLFPPVNKFNVKPTIKVTHFIKTEYKPTYLQPPDTFFWHIKFGVGIGYAIPIVGDLKLVPSVFMGVIYSFSLSF
jgi:hypothetical protein